MPRNLWGEFENDGKVGEIEEMFPVSFKRAKLEEVQSKGPVATEENVTVKIKNPLVTQTIEVMKQTEMLQSLIDTYSNKSGSSNYLLNPCQMIPEVDFPPENAADFVMDEKFAKPFWFIPPIETKFSQGVPQEYPHINAEVCRASLRKAVCGQLRVAGFTDTAESALVLFSDAIEEFVRNFMEQIRDVHVCAKKDAQNTVEMKNLEKAYYSLTNSSLTDVHNYFKHNLIARNRSEISEFNGVFQEYDKLMKESQSMQKQEFEEGDILNILEMSNSNEASISIGTGSHLQEVVASTSNSVIRILEGQSHMTAQNTGSYKDVFQTKSLDSEVSMHDQQTGETINPYTVESLLQTHEQ